MRLLAPVILSGLLSQWTFADEPEPLKAAGNYSFGKLTIVIEEAEGRKGQITVFGKDKTIISRRTFADGDLEPVGGYSGLWIPKKQPVPEVFLLTKHGSYDGRTILITERGKMIDLPGGFYFFDAATGRFYSKHESDLEELVTVLEDTLEVAGASADPKSLRDREGKLIRMPATFVRLPELAEQRQEVKKN